MSRYATAEVQGWRKQWSMLQVKAQNIDSLPNNIIIIP
jgi:hypothetical protein